MKSIFTIALLAIILAFSVGVASAKPMDIGAGNGTLDVSAYVEATGDSILEMPDVVFYGSANYLAPWKFQGVVFGVDNGLAVNLFDPDLVVTSDAYATYTYLKNYIFRAGLTISDFKFDNPKLYFKFKALLF